MGPGQGSIESRFRHGGEVGGSIDGGGGGGMEQEELHVYGYTMIKQSELAV
jgi:hypothetical protein